MDEVLEEVRELGDELTQIRNTATLLVAYSRLKKAKDRFIKSRLELEAAMIASQQTVKQDEKQEALRSVYIKAIKLKTQHLRIREEVLKLQSQLSGRFYQSN